MVLSPLLPWLWPWLEKRGRTPGKPLKSALGPLFAGLAFLPLLAAAKSAGGGMQASVWWLVLAYLLLEIGGFWLATAYSETLAAQFGKLASLEIPEGGAIDFASAAAKYADLFNLLLWIGLGCALLALIVSPLLPRMMHGVK